MAKIKIAVAGLSLSEKLQKGQTIVNLETENPAVPGNEALLAAFSEAQAELKEAVLAAMAARAESMSRTAIQTVAEKKWRAALNALASYTEAVTGGDPVKLTGTGFDVRADSTMTHVPEPVLGVIVRLEGGPGHSKLTWEPMREADGYVIEGSADLSSESNWVGAGISTKSSFSANGATAGRPYWYRVAAFNAAGQGPWSGPAARPVM